MEKKEYIESLEKLIEDEKEAVDGYDKFLAKLVDAEEKSKKDVKMTAVLNFIRTQEIEHIGKLEALIALVNNDDYEEMEEAIRYYGY